MHADGWRSISDFNPLLTYCCLSSAIAFLYHESLRLLHFFSHRHSLYDSLTSSGIRYTESDICQKPFAISSYNLAFKLICTSKIEWKNLHSFRKGSGVTRMEVAIELILIAYKFIDKSIPTKSRWVIDWLRTLISPWSDFSHFFGFVVFLANKKNKE